MLTHKRIATLLLSLIVWMGLSAGTVRAQTDHRPIVKQYGLYELSFHCPDTNGNPFDPQDNDVWAVADNSDGGELKVPAFWDGDGIWKARISPIKPGRYSIRLIRNGVDETKNAIGQTSFECERSTDPGFIRVTGPHEAWPHFTFDSGSTYFPLGMDAAWKSSDTLDYPALFAQMSRSGMNFARVWMTFWDGKAFDWAPDKSQSPPLGTLRLETAKQLDILFDSAVQSNIYVQLTLQHHGQFTNTVDPNWKDNPMNSQNPGGFLTNPNDFFSNARAMKLTEAKYRYIVARYGWCDHLLGYELFNEIQNDPELKEPDFAAWHRTMCDYIRSIDPYHHLITTSYTDPTEKLAQDTSLDYYQPHAYHSDPSEYFRLQADKTSDKPLFYGEFGASDKQTQPLLHGGLWSGLMLSDAGAQQFWYWDEVQHHNWWPEFKSLSTFIHDSGLADMKSSSTVRSSVSTELTGPLNLSPGLGWASEIGNGIVTVNPDGHSSGMENIPAYIQGDYHRDMLPHPLTIETGYSRPVILHVKISTISAAGAQLRVIIDNVPALQQDLPGAGHDVSVTMDTSVLVPAGKHSVTILNSGHDHFTLSMVSIDNAAPGVDSMVRSFDHRYGFWINRVAGAQRGPTKVKLTINDVKNSRYKVFLYNTSSGQVYGDLPPIAATGGTLTLPLNLSSDDLAGWITPISH